MAVRLRTAAPLDLHSTGPRQHARIADRLCGWHACGRNGGADDGSASGRERAALAVMSYSFVEYVANLTGERPERTRLGDEIEYPGQGGPDARSHSGRKPGFSPISIGNSLPSFFNPKRSRPAPIGRDSGRWKNEVRRSGWWPRNRSGTIISIDCPSISARWSQTRARPAC